VKQQFDIAIIGGGPVGAALALALRNSKLRVCVLEARPANKPSTDARALALAYGSRLLLGRLGIWNELDEISPIRTIHISQQRSFGRTLLHAEDLAVSELGYVLPYPVLQDEMTHALRGSKIEVINSAVVNQLDPGAEHVQIDYQQEGTQCSVEARLAVVADGGKLLEQKNPPVIHDYGQSAVITHVTCSAPRSETAFERFTPQGPLALLPYKDGYELVWTAPHSRAEEMLQWSEAEFLEQLHTAFGDRVGEFRSAGKPSCFPLGLKRAPQQSPMPRTVLLGNAAQTMHPVAGQGFNLGLRDAWELAQVIQDCRSDALGDETMLSAYRRSRRVDREGAIKFTDSLVRLFSNDIPLLTPARAASLTALDCLPFAKKFVARRMMFGANG
jgi:2-octaprenyl-6-methoxyphenol hydroxylase